MSLVSLRIVKDKVCSIFPLDSSLRALILKEPDFIEESEFYNKVSIWLALAEIEAQKQSLGASGSSALVSTRSFPEGDRQYEQRSSD